MLILGNVFTDAVSHMFHWILLWLDGVIYWAASKCYQLFMMLSSARIFEDEFFANFARRIYAILGVFMLFYLAYALLMAIVDPDKYSKGDKGVGNIAINFVVSLIILGLVPTIFSYAYRLQNFVLSKDLMGTIILGTPLNDNNSNVVSFGDSVSFTVLNTFINPGNVNVNMGKQQSFTWWDCKKEILENSEYGCLTGIAYPYVYQNTNDAVKYYGLISTLVGGYLVYILLTFTLDLGVRVVKLAFYQLIAPIPIIMRALPSKKDSFNKWLKKTIATYADVFIRVGFMYMSVYFINRIVLNNELGNYLNGGPVGLLVLCVIILGIFTFAKGVSKEISDILGVDANLKFGIKDKLKASGPLGNLINNAVGSTTGLVTGAAGAGWTAAVNRDFSGIGRAMRLGAFNGFATGGAQFSKQRQKAYEAMGYKGKAGFFGKRAFVDYWQDKSKDRLSDHFKDKILSERVNNYENPETNASWANQFNQNLKQQLDKIGLGDMSMADFNAIKKNLESLDDKKKILLQDKINKLRKYLSDENVSVETKDAIKKRIEELKIGDLRNISQEEIKQDKDYEAIVDSDNLIRQEEYKIGGPRTEKINRWVWDESKQKAVVDTEYVTVEEAAAYKATRKHFRDIDIGYDHDVVNVTTRMTESSNKEWATTEEGQHLIYAHAQANKAASGEGGPAPKPSGGGPGGGPAGGGPGGGKK